MGELRVQTSGQSFPYCRPPWESPSPVTPVFCDKRVGTIDLECTEGRGGWYVTRQVWRRIWEQQQQVGAASSRAPPPPTSSVPVQDALSQPGLGVDGEGLLSSHYPGLLISQLCPRTAGTGVHPVCLSSYRFHPSILLRPSSAASTTPSSTTPAVNTFSSVNSLWCLARLHRTSSTPSWAARSA